MPPGAAVPELPPPWAVVALGAVVELELLEELPHAARATQAIMARGMRRFNGHLSTSSYGGNVPNSPAGPPTAASSGQHLTTK